MGMTHKHALAILDKLRFTDRGCWEWLGARTTGNPHHPGDKGGYAKLYYEGRTWLGNRLLYTLRFGPIPKGMELDHIECDNRACINPMHVRVTTSRENQARTQSATALNAKKTVCRNGHPYTAETLGLQKNGRYCKICRREDFKRYHRRRKLGIRVSNGIDRRV